ncbi:unnamed protein product [Closterium sp. NIES-65]|nr:unnamed protein product [Closterium sp. NIES-65]
MELMQAALHALKPPSFAVSGACEIVATGGGLVRFPDACRLWDISGVEATDVIISGVEADDVIATLATEALQNGMKVGMLQDVSDLSHILPLNDMSVIHAIIDSLSLRSPVLFVSATLTPLQAWQSALPTSHFYTYAEEDFRRDWGDVDPPLFADILALMGDVSDNIPVRVHVVWVLAVHVVWVLAVHVVWVLAVHVVWVLAVHVVWVLAVHVVWVLAVHVVWVLAVHVVG